jgi:hypothetical protein
MRNLRPAIVMASAAAIAAAVTAPAMGQTIEPVTSGSATVSRSSSTRRRSSSRTACS